jgi:hypothetical protein
MIVRLVLALRHILETSNVSMMLGRKRYKCRKIPKDAR